MPLRKRKTPKVAAAVDLGSNSFHMIVARIEQDELVVVDRLREAVRLANGIDQEGNLSEESQQRALDCLQRFGQRLTHMPPGSVRAVGTNTLRNTENAEAFLGQASQALGHPIDIISGVEEARLIYLGVSKSLAGDSDRRFVMDIGGGSTELIIGEGTTPQWMESLEMGCITTGRRFFPDQAITAQRVEQARMHALVELEPVALGLRRRGWQQAVGASGSIRAATSVVKAAGLVDEGITFAALDKVLKQVIQLGHFDKLQLPGLSAERTPIFTGGLIILHATFEALGIDDMKVADGALREGLLYDLVGRIHNEDVRSRSVANLAQRYHVDRNHADVVQATAQHLLERVGESWVLDEDDGQWLSWAAQLHEIGIDIAHSRHHHHAAYIIANADMPGFTQQEQQLLAGLVRAHRRKFPAKLYRDLPKRPVKSPKRLAILLRLAVILRRSRSNQPLPALDLTVEAKVLTLTFPGGWLTAHPLTRADLEEEAQYLAAAGYELKFL